MHTRIVGAAGAALVALAFAACGGDDNGDKGTASSAGSTLTIYSSLPLQGDSRPQSEDVVKASRWL